ncbi:MAG: SDR family NAD(P)-dependent oxidoreductase [Gammaproteobacteria bacterium]|jgi:NAD(P)-dependent dehydrogenase (short-subunit alcohol dehydrogenase family)|nr:SDR family NAD(P)-dependent oxidoreductase [Gammaproteobacteria bacterium]MBT5440759.1 SDR family NAD(P)-dependent oxidoreductase [Candidatus Neomarinimicrobiota bacterium]MBT6074284.1 SDR family NAD(P)-dependent oxidoreductase [Gammaproteobacteria bacterium]MBT7754144.1 SDR family NAD(P)-dependent oxidoreductase [Gammaproteobacteria bacterium]
MKTVLITGGNRGLGLEFVKQYSQLGYKIIVTCRNPNEAKELNTLKENSKTDIKIHTLDVTNHEEIDLLSKSLSNKPIDIIINNAGIIGPFPIFEHIEKQRFTTMDYTVWEKVLRTNLFGPVKISESFLENIKNGQEKKIIFISSTVGSINEGKESAYAYATSKTALNKAISLMAENLKNENIHVLALCPGYVKTRMNAGGANLETDESIKGMIKQIDSLDESNTGTFIRYNGELITW